MNPLAFYFSLRRRGYSPRAARNIAVATIRHHRAPVDLPLPQSVWGFNNHLGSPQD